MPRIPASTWPFGDDMPLEDVVITSQAGLHVGAPAPEGAFRLAGPAWLRRPW